MVIFMTVFATVCCGAAELWSLKPLDRSVLRAGSLDHFVAEGLKKRGLASAGKADRRTLIRRAYFDLTGLPPTPEEVAAFVKDESPDAWPRLIEKLLASPHYGEQWARHWLDVARYSDTKGYVYAREEKRWVHAWTYRDWVVRAFNSNTPYDRFLKLQIAADQIVPAGSPDLAAMGYLTLGRRFLGVTHDIIDDRIDVVTRGMLGLTVACARCHDHKFDPVPTTDYYALYGVFQSSAEKLVPCGELRDEAFKAELTKRQQKLADTMAKRRDEQSSRVRKRLADHLMAQLELEKYPEEVFGQLLDEKDLNPFVVRKWQTFLMKDAESQRPVFARWHALRKSGAKEQLKALADDYAARSSRVTESAVGDPLHGVLYGPGSPCFVPDEHIANNEMYFPTGAVTELWKLQGEVDRWLMQGGEKAHYATILVDKPLPSTPRVFLRGNPVTKGEEVSRRFLGALSGGKSVDFTRGSGRLELAEAVADKRNPLTARVMVNRVWMHHFGKGLVATPSDFGARSEPPSHPELLDWLALRFMDSGWSVKDLHRVIMLSSTYQQSSEGDEKGLQIDPDNRLLWRMRAHRLSFEEARDAWLQATGELSQRIGGVAEKLFDPGSLRRTIYAFVDRENVPDVLRTFDFANPDLSIPQRNETTVPQQALFGINNPFLVQRVKAMMRRIDVKSVPDDAARVTRIYELLFQRAPSRTELDAALEFVKPPPEAELAVSHDEAKAWTYGYGEWDETSGRLRDFKPLPHFTGSAWQGEDAFPNKTLGWAQLTAKGGHPGNDRKHAVVRRWIAPSDGAYSLKSVIKHVPEVGDGIRAFVGHSRLGLLRSLTLQAAEETVNLDSLECRAGDAIDFVVDIGVGLNSDQFLWAPTITATGSAGSGGDIKTRVWDAAQDFGGTEMPKLNPWEQWLQVLMLSNEFLFVD